MELFLVVFFNSRQIAIDHFTHNIFVADYRTSRIIVFTGEGDHVYEILSPSDPIGIAISNEYTCIFISTGEKLVLKIDKSNNEFVKSIETENDVYGIETNSNTDLYLCEHTNRSIIVYDSDLVFQRRIKLNSL